MPRDGLKTILTKPGEFAPGIPRSRKIRAIPRVAHSRPQEWRMALQQHDSVRAGPHTDLRLVDKKGRAHSWAIPNEKGLPKPGEKFPIQQTATHTKEYAAKKGSFLIPEGTYGAGKVEGSGLSPVEIVSRRPGVLRFNDYSGRSPQELSIIDTPKGQILYNHTITKETGVRGVGGHLIPQSKPKYREKRPESIRFDDEGEVHQAKLDGASATIHLPGGSRQIRAFSYRPTKRETGVIEHTHKLHGFRRLKTPSGLAGTVLRGELWAADSKGRALPAERVGGILNASVPKSRELQARHGKLRAAPFDVVRYKGRNVEKASYEKKLEMLAQVHKQIPFLKPPPTARTPAQKKRLFARIQAGSLKETKEGVVSWPLAGGRPTKIKLRPDVDTEVVGVFAGKGKHKGRAGGLLVRTSKDAPVTRVGTGFSNKQREQLWRDRDQIVGRVAKVEAQKVFPSGKLRDASFREWHIEKGKQAAMRGLEKTAVIKPGQIREGTLKAKSFADFRRKMKPGDIVLTKPGSKGTSVLNPVVRAYDFLSGAKHPGWIHGAMYMGKGQIAHLDDKKLQRGKVVKHDPQLRRGKLKLFDESNYDLLAIRPQSGAREAVKKMGQFADSGAKITTGKFVRNLLRTGVLPIGGREITDAVCTGVVGEAYKHAPLAKRRPLMMRPKDFLESRRAKHLISFSRDVERGVEPRDESEKRAMLLGFFDEAKRMNHGQ